jgi:hypothetical protein
MFVPDRWHPMTTIRLFTFELMKVKIGIRYYPRKQETILRSLKTIGNIRPIIYPDGVEYPFPNQYEIRNLGNNVGCFKHYYRTLEDLVKEDADIVGCFSDDIHYRKDWLNTALQGFEKPNVGFVSCYVPRGVAERYSWKRHGFHRLNKGWASTWGGGYLFRKEIAIELLNHPFMIRHRDTYKKNQQIDHCLPEVMRRIKKKQLFHVPSLMTHIGHTSTIGHQHRPEDVGVGWAK